MDLLSSNIIAPLIFFVKLAFFIVGAVVVLISYFQAKEARKMERKLRIEIPGSVSLAISGQVIFSVAFLFLALILLFIPSS